MAMGEMEEKVEGKDRGRSTTEKNKKKVNHDEVIFHFWRWVKWKRRLRERIEEDRQLRRTKKKSKSR
jgi:hypothetical protein